MKLPSCAGKKLFPYFPLLLLLVWLSPSWAEGLPENTIKSAYVLNFAKFVEWPEGIVGPDDKLTLCVIGRNVLGGALMDLEGRKVGSHELHIVLHPNADDNLGGCHLVFIGVSEQHRVATIINALGNPPGLTISDIADFAENGGCIGLSHADSRIAFEVNLSSTLKSKLRLPSQLLNLASNVFGR